MSEISNDEFYKQLRNITGEELPNASKLPTQKKAAIAQHFRDRGWKVAEIAEHLECSAKYVYDLLKKDTEELISELECRTYLENYANIRKMLMHEIDYHKKCLEDLRAGYMVVKKDKDGNDVEVNQKGSPRDHVERSRIVMKYQEMLIRLEKDMGTLPVAGTKSVYGALKDQSPEDQKDETLLDMNDEDINKLLLAKLSGATSTVRPKTLKEMKNEKMLGDG